MPALDYLGLFGLGALALLVSPLVLTSWRLAWILYIFCVASNGISIALGPATFRIDLLALPLLAAALLFGRRDRRSQPKHLPLIVVGFVGWTATGIASSVTQSPEVVSSLGVVAWVFLGMTTFLVVAASRVHPSELVRVASPVVGLISAIGVASWSLRQVGLDTPFVLADSSGVDRVVWLSFEPNLFGAFAVLWVALIVYWRSSLPVSAHLWAVVTGLAAVLSMTRVVWVALLLVLLPLARETAGRFFRGVAAVVAVATAILLAFPYVSGELFAPIGERLSRISDLGSGTAAFRIGSWQIAFEDLAQGNWIFGLGVNTFTQRHFIAVETKQTDYLSNAWVAQLHDVGVLGTAFLLLAYAAVYASAFRKLEAMALMVAFALTSAFTSALWFAFPWLFMGLLDFSGRNNPDLEGAPRKILVRSREAFA